MHCVQIKKNLNGASQITNRLGSKIIRYYNCVCCVNAYLKEKIVHNPTPSKLAIKLFCIKTSCDL